MMLIKRLLLLVLGISLLSNISVADEQAQLDETDKVSYSLGYQIGKDYKRQGVKIRPEVLTQGLEDALSGSAALMLMTEEDIQTTLSALQQKITAQARIEQANKGQNFREEGRIFLAENAKKEGVKTTASGLQYKVLKAGSGKTPASTDNVTVNYRGTTIDGKEFDSSYRGGKPVVFRVDEVISGWEEALQMMKEGARWQLFIPPQLAYHSGGPLEHRTILFEVELISVN
jgi:FKBP-type peptidyl-prolyl cis-trans isomerase FklB